MNCIVYGLYSSRDPGELRYIGQTTQSPDRRYSQHKNYAKRKKTAVHNWFLREIENGFEIELRVLVEGAVFNVTETEMIARYRNAGARLLNLTDGGEGTVGWHGNAGKKRPDLAARNMANKGKPGRPLSPENKGKLIAACKTRDTTYLVVRNKTNHPWIGKKHTPEWFEKMRGRKVTPETRAKMSAALKGRIFSDEHRKKISEREITDETRKKISASHSGKVMPDAVKEKIRLAMIGRFLSAETRAKISAVHKGKVVSEESRRRISEARLAYFAKKKAQDVEASILLA